MGTRQHSSRCICVVQGKSAELVAPQQKSGIAHAATIKLELLLACVATAKACAFDNFGLQSDQSACCRHKQSKEKTVLLNHVHLLRVFLQQAMFQCSHGSSPGCCRQMKSSFNSSRPVLLGCAVAWHRWKLRGQGPWRLLSKC